MYALYVCLDATLSNSSATRVITAKCNSNVRSMCLEHAGVAAVNFYGVGARNEIGPYVPTDCPNLEECKICVEPYYQVTPLL